MRDPELLKRATALWRGADGHQMQGDLERAIELYQRSIDVYPTAEAHTFLGWTLSFQGRLEEATRECLKAIEVDPDFGNPYNDIGCYLMQQGKFEEAIPWLEKAKRAPRYEPRQFPYMNLGRIHLRQGHWWEAPREVGLARQGRRRRDPAATVEPARDAPRDHHPPRPDPWAHGRDDGHAVPRRLDGSVRGPPPGRPRRVRAQGRPRRSPRRLHRAARGARGGAPAGRAARAPPP